MTTLGSIKDRLTVLRNTLGEPVATAEDPQGDLRAVAPNGRLVVAAGQTISSAWGNTTYDQTMQTFATAGDRTNQWPAPNEGAQSFLVDSHTPWIFRSGAWHALPMGYMASAVGPASQTDCGAAFVTVVSATFSAVAGRRYRSTSMANSSQVTGAGTSRTQIIDSQGGQTWIAYNASLAVSSVLLGTGVLMTAPSTASVTISVQGATNAGALRFAANQATLLIEDIGG